MVKKYHREVGFPRMVAPTGKIDVSHTDHAKRKAKYDKSGGFNLPKKVEITTKMFKRNPEKATADKPGEKTDPHIFEIETERKKATKVVIRKHYDETRDIVLVVKPYQQVIVTAWTNKKEDHHDTLDKSQYDKP
jgi:hypothetical protein